MILNTLKPLVYYFKSKPFNISDPVFKIHTKLTVYLLLIFACFVSGHAFSGKPIDCIVDFENLKSIAETICWANGTFTEHKVPTMMNGRPSIKKIPQYQRYYQWIIIILLAEAALFSVPERLWKAWEHGRIGQLCTGLNDDVLTPECPDYQKGKDRIINYLKTKNSRIHGSYVFRYVFCEVLNFLNVVLNMIILNVIFDQFWRRYLPAILSLFSMEKATFSSLASEIFPLTAKCFFTRVGPSGSVEERDALCLLTQNVVNEKVFAFLYIWYVLLLFVSGCNLIWRSMILLSSCLRFKIIQSSAKWTNPLSEQELKKILPNDNIGDWFIIFLLGQNLNRLAFRDILNDLAEGKGQMNNEV